ncbi:MAG: hypothetical protein KDA90_15790 [Planctomycetaceae bacterium]|nr:hypothetical protein [Planctomycetaceae bacterium]
MMCFQRLLISMWLLMASLMMAAPVHADDGKKSDKLQPAGQFITLKSPLTDESLGAVRRAALELQDVARKEQREAFLILELTPGASQFHHTYALAEFLATESLANLTTIAWIPESIEGNNVFVALACQEIVMHPDAAIGDMGRGKALPRDQQTIIKGIVEKRRNKKVNTAIAEGLMDPATVLLQLTIGDRAGAREKRLVTQAEAKQLQEQGVEILDSRTIKEAGTPWSITGAQARADDILAMRTATSRRDIIDAYGLPLEALREKVAGDRVDRVAYIELRDEINALFFSFAQRQIDRAVRDNVKVIIFEIDSPGGDLWYSRDLAFLIADLSEKDIKTVAYIPDKAYSGGTIVALGCDEIYMRPTATLGDAIPLQFSEGAFIHAEEKILSLEREMLHALAERKNRPAAVLEAMADKNLQVFEATHRTTGRTWYMSEDEIHAQGDEWLQGPRVPESRDGVAITISGKRAAELRVTEPPVQDIDQLRERLGIPLDLKFDRIERTWVDSLVFVLNNNVVAGFILFVAVVSIYIELHTMTGFFGIASVIAFGLFFWSKILGGTAGGLEIVLFLLGMGFLAMEVFVIPGFGVFGVSGILLIVGSLVMASQTFTGLNYEYDLLQTGKTLAVFGTSLFAVMLTGMLLSNFLPRIPFLKDMILSPPGVSTDGPRLRPDLGQAANPLVGAMGTAVTILRPAGKARLNGELHDVVSDGPFISEGAEIEVVQISGNRIVVRETSSPS